jgi:long-chain acyl-CoA synthetase
VTNLARNLTNTTRAHAGRVAVRVDNAAMTYRALDEASARVAGLLHERGLKPGDRVGIMMPNVAEVPVVYYGVLRAGGVVVPMNPHPALGEEVGAAVALKPGAAVTAGELRTTSRAR